MSTKKTGRPKSGYHDEQGTPLPGTTSITGRFGDKAALIGWAGKTCYLAGYEDAREGIGQRKWNDVLYGQRDKAADAGTLGHTLFDAFLRGVEAPEFDAPMDVRIQAQSAFENAKHWLTSSAIKIIPFEEPLVSKIHRYGGTPDALGETEHVLALMDWKTGSLYPDHVVQMAAYRHLLRECKGLRPKGAHLVRFPRDGKGFNHHYITSDQLDTGWQLFLLWRQAWDLDKELGGMLK